MVLHSNDRLLSSPANIRLEWTWMAMANTLAYYGMATITAVKNYSRGLVSNLYNFVIETEEKKTSACL
jgi:hypothetical protein